MIEPSTHQHMRAWWETDYWREYEALAGGDRHAELQAATWQTQVIDQWAPLEFMWGQVRKSYRSLIRRAEPGVSRVRPEHCVGFALNVAAPLHERVAGRVTRPLETWQLMGEWARDGYAGIWNYTSGPQSTTLGFVYVVVWLNWAYYFSSVSLEHSLTHAVLWRAITDLRQLNVRWFEVGWQDRPGDSLKDKQIAFFKRGFGGVAMSARDAPRLACAS